MPPIATPKATTVPQSAREWPRSFGRHTTSRISAAAASRSVTTPSAPAFGISSAATAEPNWTERPPPTTSTIGTSAARRALPGCPGPVPGPCPAS